MHSIRFHLLTAVLAIATVLGASSGAFQTGVSFAQECPGGNCPRH